MTGLSPDVPAAACQRSIAHSQEVADFYDKPMRLTIPAQRVTTIIGGNKNITQIIDTMFFAAVVGALFCIGLPMLIRAIRARSSSRYLAISALLISCLVGFTEVAFPFGELLGSIDGHRPAVSIAIIFSWLASSLPKANGGRWIDLIPVALFLILYLVFVDQGESMKALD